MMNNNNAEWVDVVTNNAKVFQLANDITLDNSWAVDPTKDFCCTLDGARHTLTVSSAMNAGFFSKLGAGAVIKDLNLKLAGITSSNKNTGGLADEVAGTVSIDNVHVSGTAVDSEITASGGYVVGGLIGYVNGNLTLTRSSFNMNIAGTLINPLGGPGSFAGGLVGKSPEQNCKLTMVACYSTGNISTNGESEGGLIGATVDGLTLYSQFNIQSCYSTCTVSRTVSSNDYGTGRLCGELSGTSSADIFSYNVSTSSTKVEILTGGYHPSAEEGIGNVRNNSKATHTGNAVGVADGDVYGKLTAGTSTVVILGKTYNINDLWQASSGGLPVINMNATSIGTVAE